MKIENLKLKTSLLITLLYIATSFAPIARAESLSLSVDPSIIEINAIPPSIATSSLTIQNKGDKEVMLQIQLKPFKARSENASPPATSSTQSEAKQAGVAGEVGRGELQYLNEDFALLKNVQILDNGVPIENITLGPTQQKNLTLNINISQDIGISARPPSSSPEGEVGRDYYFSIIFISKNSLTPDSTASLNQLGIASNVILSVGAKENPDAILEEFSSGLFYESGPVPFTIRIKNKGKHFIKPKSEILIKNMFGQTIGKLDLPVINVLSDSTRAMPKALWNEDFLLGFYTATLTLSLSDDGHIFSKSINFFAFPFQGLILIVIVVISAIITMNRVRTHMKK